MSCNSPAALLIQVRVDYLAYTYSTWGIIRLVKRRQSLSSFAVLRT